jgi:hypothetical protein
MSANENPSPNPNPPGGPYVYWGRPGSKGEYVYEGDIIAGQIPNWLSGRLRLLHAGGLIVALRLRRVNERHWPDEDLAKMTPDYADATDADLLRAVVEATNFIAGNIHDDAFLGDHWGMFAKRLDPKHQWFGNIISNRWRDGLVVDTWGLNNEVCESVRHFNHFLGLHHRLSPYRPDGQKTEFRFVFHPLEWWADEVTPDCLAPDTPERGDG